MSKPLFRLPSMALLVVIVALAAMALVILAGDGSFQKEDLAAGLFALFGTFAGALLAFRLEEGKERAKKVALRRRRSTVRY